MGVKLDSQENHGREEATLKQWLIDNQIGICLALLAPLALARCTGMTRTEKFTSLSYYNPETDEYGVGFDDNYLVLFLVVLLTALRDVTMRCITSPIATSWGLSKSKKARFNEQAWLFIYYATGWTIGMYIYVTSVYWLDLKSMWTKWPNREVSGTMKWYMLAQTAFWLQQMVTINIEKRRKDYWQMVSHHLVTIALCYSSYRYGLTRVSHVTLILMDFNDLVFSAAKCLKYLGLQTACDIMFGFFVMSWVWCRHVAFVMVCWSGYAHSLPIHGKNCYIGSGDTITGPEPVPRDGFFYILEPLIYDSGRICYDLTINWMFVGGLLFLEGLMIFWLVMILKLVVRILRGGNVEDTRSDDEEEVEVEEELFQTVDAKDLKLPLQPPKGRTSSFAAGGLGISTDNGFFDRIGCKHRIS
ncbi:Sphingosine N-acyltransferase lag1 [Fusarium irregulare]|uniref:Sphingosine N-acyltransferase lag1 n=1 Tax=Fusarium irregulare TaxID=2494466 RepID=A0A9W8PGB0_9HYPO|nr:Sphingosine N-acyltransferase lag1 [Fusarium irregulare]KAJ4026296.1 Sphingosine N-acyltransferase lag1 [Fusarium irregulare]